MRGQRPVRRHRPALDRALPVVRDAEPERRRGGVAVRRREIGRRDEARDLGGDRGGREAALLLPALGPERRAVRDQEVRRRLDVAVVERGIREPELLRHQDREGDLVELRPERVGCGLAVDEAVSRHRAVRQLLALEQEQRRVARGGEVAVGEEARPRLVEVAGEDLAIGAEVGVRRVAGRDRLTPRRGEARHDRAGEGLVLGGLEDVRAQVVLVGELVDGLLLQARRASSAACSATCRRTASPCGSCPAPCRSRRRASPLPPRPPLPASRRSRASAPSCRPRRGRPARSGRRCRPRRRGRSASARAFRRAGRGRRSPRRRSRSRPRRTTRRARRRPAARSRGSRRSSP